jgi:CheY-like chemotaxis protein
MSETSNGTLREIGETSPPPASQAEHSFRANLNHKLRTPLNAIIGFAELLALQPGNRRDSADVQQILKSARELLRIIERELSEPDENSVEEHEGIAALSSGCDVLYIEDDLVNFTLVERILEFRPGINLVHAPKAELGIELAELYQPKLILLDLNLPDMHGGEVLRHLQQKRATEKIPVVVLSADATPSQIERLLAAGARNYLTKPFDIDPFLTLVDEFVVEPRIANGSLEVVS